MRERKAQKILRQVKDTYHEIAEDFDRTRKNAGKEFAEFAKYVKESSHIIDLGCGNGRLLLFLEELFKNDPKPFYKYLGIDNSPSLLKIAQRNFPHQNFIEGDQLEIPVEHGIADVVFNIRAFHHIPSKTLRIQALSEMNRILRENGVLIITVWNLWQKKYLKYLLAGILRFFYTLGGYAPNDTLIPWGKKARRYYHAFTPFELHKLVSRCGFEIEEQFYVKDGMRVPWKRCHDIVIVAKKVTNAHD